MGLRLGIDLDGVVADFNRGWTLAYNDAFDAALAPEMVSSWDSPRALTHFPDMPAFWGWTGAASDHPWAPAPGRPRCVVPAAGRRTRR